MQTAGLEELEAGLRDALREFAAHLDSEPWVGKEAAVRAALMEDEEDLAAFEARAREPNLAFEEVLKDLKLRGQL